MLSARRAPAHHLFILILAALVGCAPADNADDTAGAGQMTAPPDVALSIADVGLATPESVLHDATADVYLVSNINGDPMARDDNGFITRIRPDGSVDQLRWIDGAAEGVALHAPKGMALHGDTLFVADIDTVRAFDRTSGAPLGARGIPGATFLNDLASGEDGTLYVSDTGFGPGFAPSGSNAVYRLDAAGATAIVRGDALEHPNGIVVDGSDVIIVPFGGATIRRVPAGGGTLTDVATLPAGQLDGVVRLPDGSLLVSSWEGSAVYHVAADGTVTAVMENVESPADIGWDATRQRLLVPVFNQHRLEVRVYGTGTRAGS